MNIRIFTLLILVCISLDNYAHKIGLLIVATNKYIEFVEPLIASAERYFCPQHEVTYFVFTNGQLRPAANRVRIEEKHQGWPFSTMMRIVMYYEHRDQWQHMDYLFAIDADMLFVDTVGDEILSDRVGTLHPGYVGTKGTYERRSISTAYVQPHEGIYYFAGGFHGGCCQEFLTMVRTMTENILLDLGRNVIAIYHDESHLNRYFINNPPTKILSPSYCMPGSEQIIASYGLRAYPKKLLALVKNHQHYRN